MYKSNIIFLQYFLYTLLCPYYSRKKLDTRFTNFAILTHMHIVIYYRLYTRYIRK